MRDVIQPAAQHDAAADRAGLLDQDQEGGLEGVLGVVGVAQDAVADAQDHRSVPRHQRLEGRGIAPMDEPLEELGVGKAGDRPIGEQAVDLSQGGAQRLDGHASDTSSTPRFTIIRVEGGPTGQLSSHGFDNLRMGETVARNSGTAAGTPAENGRNRAADRRGSTRIRTTGVVQPGMAS